MAKKKPAVTEKKTNEPKKIGTFDDWTAATYQEAGQLVCYAFTLPQNPTAEPKNRGRVALTVTQRTSIRDAVAIEAGFNYDSDAAVSVKADQTALDFYTDKRNAFARDNRAAVTAFNRSSRAVATSPGPRSTKVIDSFSLKGFSAAYAAIGKACPQR